MNKTLSFNSKIVINGSKKDIEAAITILEACGQGSGVVLNCGASEARMRFKLQNIISEHKIKATILYDGNTVWNKEKVVNDVKKVLKHGMGSMTNYLYQFVSLACGSIAHYSKRGWIAEYPTVDDFKNFFIRNEFGRRVLAYQPTWASDRIEIVNEIERIMDI